MLYLLIGPLWIRSDRRYVFKDKGKKQTRVVVVVSAYQPSVSTVLIEKRPEHNLVGR